MGITILLATAPARAEMVIINGKNYDSNQKPSLPNPGATPVVTETAPVAPPPLPSPPVANDPLKIKKVFLFPSLDDLQGALAPALDQALVNIFARNPRFELVRDPQVVRALSPDEAAYAKAAESPAVHREAARVTGADTTVFLKARSVGGDTELTLEFRDGQGDPLLSETGSVPGRTSAEARTNLVNKLFTELVNRIPFDGTVTGRSANTLTLDLGGEALRTGDEVTLARVVSVQRHPLLRTVVGSDYVRTGKARVVHVDKALSFAEVTEESPGESIRPGAKVLLTRDVVVRRPDPRAERAAPALAKEESNPLDERLEGEFDRKKARYGWAGLNLQFGSLTHSQTESAGVTELSGSGLGGNVDGELWITKEWVANVYYGFHNASLSGSGLSVGSTTWKKFEMSAGYRFAPDALLEGLQLTGSLGYQSEEFVLPTVPGARVSGKTYTGIVLKLDGEAPIVPGQKVSGGFAFQPFASFAERESLLGETGGANVVNFHLAWHYRLSDSFWAKAGLEFDVANGNYRDGNSASDKRFAIGPGIYYSF